MRPRVRLVLGLGLGLAASSCGDETEAGATAEHNVADLILELSIGDDEVHVARDPNSVTEDRAPSGRPAI